MVSNEPLIPLVAFVGVFAQLAMGEVTAPRRSRSHSRFRRWPSNVAISALNTGFVTVVFPATYWSRSRPSNRKIRLVYGIRCGTPQEFTIRWSVKRSEMLPGYGSDSRRKDDLLISAYADERAVGPEVSIHQRFHRNRGEAPRTARRDYLVMAPTAKQR
jgi:hypothetical protein